MRIESALALHGEFIDLLKKDIRTHGGQYGINTFGAAPPQAKHRLAIGLGRSNSGPQNFRIELRLQRGRGPAWKLAEDFKRRAHNEINIVDTRDVVAGLARSMSTAQARMARPLCIGVSVGHIDRSSSGTLGAFVTNKQGEDYLLSCAHVLSAPGQSKRKQIIQPGAADIDQSFPGNVVAELADPPEFYGGRLNSADAAVARIREDIEHAGNLYPRYGAVRGAPADFLQFVQSHKGEVRKLGKATGSTRGRISAWNLNNLSVYFDEYEQAFAFEQVIEIEPLNRTFAKPGDSGALLVSHADNTAIGLVFAGHFGPKRNVVYANPIAEALSAVGMQLATH
jgi:hypothetical protein